MKNGRLFLSFWDIGLENLPEGIFRRRRIALAKAKAHIEAARRNQTLICVTDKDFLAPYHQHERESQEELCAALKKHCGISLTLRDFLDEFEHEGKPSYAIMPLVIAEVRGADRLLVITCRFTLDLKKHRRRPKGKFGEIDPTTIEFHLFEAITSAKKPASKKTVRRRAKKPGKS